MAYVATTALRSARGVKQMRMPAAAAIPQLVVLCRAGFDSSRGFTFQQSESTASRARFTLSHPNGTRIEVRLEGRDQGDSSQITFDIQGTVGLGPAGAIMRDSFNQDSIRFQDASGRQQAFAGPTASLSQLQQTAINKAQAEVADYARRGDLTQAVYEAVTFEQIFVKHFLRVAPAPGL